MTLHYTPTSPINAPDLHIGIQILRRHLSSLDVEVSDCCMLFPGEEGEGGGGEGGGEGREEGGREGRGEGGRE